MVDKRDVTGETSQNDLANDSITTDKTDDKTVKSDTVSSNIIDGKTADSETARNNTITDHLITDQPIAADRADHSSFNHSILSNRSLSNSTGEVAEGIFRGGGEMGALMRSFNWSQTSLGSVETWPQSLKTAVRIMLTSRQAMFVWWGDDLINLYNDAYKAILGGKHPVVLGQPAAKVWQEIWDQVGPRAESAMLKNEGTYDEALLLIMERNGYPEETYYTFSYSPVPNDQGSTGGILCANTDDTQRIVGERQLELLRKLATQTADARTFDDACRLSAECLESNPYDLPFALIYLIDPDRQQVILAETCGMGRDHVAVVERVDLDFGANSAPNPDAAIWPFAEVIRTQTACLVSDLDTRFADLPSGAWNRSPHQAVAVPIAPSGQTGKAGILIVGLNPFRLFNDAYRGFVDLIAAQIAASIANAQAYEEERKRSEALAELDRAKTLFFSNVSHEFRTPLTLMLGPAEDALADRDHPLPFQQQERIELLHRNGLRLLKLVNTLLDFSRIESGRVQAVYEPTDLAQLTTDLCGVFQSAIERAGLWFQIDCPPLPEPIYVDREMWEKIVFNLLSNAFKFTFEGGIAVTLRWFNDRVELTVQDTGIGIPETEIPRLFERFHRIQGTRARTHEGSGIGLSLVQELVKLHGGTIAATSQVNQGTCFVLSILTGSAHLASDRIHASRTLASTAIDPSSYAEEARRWLPDSNEDEIQQGDRTILPDFLLPSAGFDATFPPALQTELDPIFPYQESQVVNHPSPSASANILLADDNADMRDYVRRLLQHRYAVQTVGNGLAALAAIQQQKPDLVLTDVMMPELDGFALLQQLRADPATREIPIILLSARAGEESRVEGLEAGADDYLIKPFSARELLARVEANLQMAQLRQETTRREIALRFETQTAKENLENVLSRIGDQFLALDRQWNYTYVNDRVLAVVGCSREELLGKNIWQLFPDTVDTLFYTEVHRAVAEQTPVHFEYFYPASDRWFENHVYPAPDGVSLLVAEITDRKRSEAERQQAERALQEAEQRLRLAMAAADLGIWDFDPSTGKLAWDDCCKAMFGLPPDTEINYDSFLAGLHPDDRDSVDQTVQWTLNSESGGNLNIEYRTVGFADGIERWVVARGQAFFNQAGAAIRFVGTVLNITERKQAEAKIRQQSHRLQRLSEASLTINSTLSLSEIVHLITEQSRNIIGAHQSVTSMAIHQNWNQAIHTISLSEKYAQWQNYVAKPDGSGIYAIVCQMQRPMRLTQAELEAHPAWRGFGKEAAYHPPMRGWLAAPLTSRNGDNIGLIQLSDKDEGDFTAEDEAILVQLAQMAAAAIDKAYLYEESQRTNRIKDEFLAVLSHELRTPLNPILGWSKLLRSGKLDQTRTTHALETIERNAKLQTQLIEDLLDVSRILQGKLNLNMIPVPMVSTIEAALETVQLAAEAKSIELRFTILEPDSEQSESNLEPENLEPENQTTGDVFQFQVLGDSARLQQVVWNLLSNAVKFTPEGGKIDIQLSQSNSQVQLIVKDTGRGIAPQFLPYVFEYFRQADGTTTRTFGGLGLGLAIVRHLVELHGGTVQAESLGENQGATFTVRLPLKKTANVEDEPTQMANGHFLPLNLLLTDVQILLVDDDVDSRSLIAFTLEQAGAKVCAVASAAEALLALGQSKFDVLLSDIGMPEMDGYTLMQQIRAVSTAQNGQIPAIALTAYAGEINQKQALAAGFQMHLSKPVDIGKLVESIDRLIQDRG